MLINVLILAMLYKYRINYISYCIDVIKMTLYIVSNYIDIKY